jgi:chromate reductase
MAKQFSVLAIPGSLRAKSFNRALLEYARRSAPASLAIAIHDIADIPLFNQDVEANGYPAPVARLHAAVAAADGILIATPEYNSGIPG